MESIIDQLQTPGVIGVIATDTVYGVVARASDTAAVGRLYALKDRRNKPGTVIAASNNQLVELGIKRRYLTAVESYWPAPLSVVVPCGPELDYLHLGLSTLAVRIPADAGIRELLSRTGPLLTSSANAPGQPVSNTVNEARAYFGDTVDFYHDGGDLSGHEPSTIIRIVDDEIEVLRPGSVQL